MHEASNQEPGQSAPHHLCDSVHATLATAFTPARLLLSWADHPTIVPGFQVRIVGVSVVVRYVQPRDGAPSLQRARALAMIEQYRPALLAIGWQVDVVDEPRKMPHLRCWLANSVMSNEGAPWLIP